MVGGDSTDHRNDTTRQFGGGASDIFDLCVVPALLRRSAFVPRRGGPPGESGRPPPGLELLSERARGEPPVGQPKIQVPRAHAQETAGSRRGTASSQPPLSRLDDSIHHRNIGPSVPYRLRHGGASLEVFTAYRDVTGVQKRPLGTTSLREGCPPIAPNAFSSRTSVVRGLSLKFGSAAVGQLQNGVRNATEAVLLLLGSEVALMARQWKRTVSWSTLTCLAVWRQSQVHQALAQMALQRRVRGLSRSRRTGVASYSPSMDETNLAYKHGAPQPNIPMIIELTNFSKDLWGHEVWALLSPSRPGRDARPQRIRDLPNEACEGDHRHIPHLSFTDKRPWSITSDCRPRDYVEQVTQVLKNSLHNDRCCVENPLLLEDPIGSILTSKRVFSDSGFCTSPRAMDAEPQKNGKGRQRRSWKVTVNCKRTETTLQVRRLTLTGSCVQVTHQRTYCTSYENSCRRLGTYVRVFQEGTSSRTCLTTSPTGKTRKCKTNVWIKRMKWLLTQQDSDQVTGVSAVHDQKDLDIQWRPTISPFYRREWDKPRFHDPT